VPKGRESYFKNSKDIAIIEYEARKKVEVLGK